VVLAGQPRPPGAIQKKLARMLRTHFDDIPVWTKTSDDQWGTGRHEQQGEGNQPSRLRLSDDVDVHCEHLPLVRGAAAARDTFGDCHTLRITTSSSEQSLDK
jgi:hypothetical protein